MSGLAIFPVLVEFESSIHYLTESQYQCDLFNTSSNPPAVVFSCCYYAGPVNFGDPLALFVFLYPESSIRMPRDRPVALNFFVEILIPQRAANRSPV